MRKISGFLILAAFMTAPVLLGSAITYTAVVDCNNNCVTVSVEWQNMPTPVSFVEVDDDLGNFLFSLNTPFPGSTTGSIVPDPQTISGLSPTVIAIITNSQAVADALAIQSSSRDIPLALDPSNYALLSLEDAEHVDITQVRFIATLAGGTGTSGGTGTTGGGSVPEPAAWSLIGGGLGVLFVLDRARRRKLQTENGSATP